MITKLVLTDSYDFGQPSTQLVPQVSYGVDKDWLRKQAGVEDIFAKEIRDLKKQAGHSVFHIIALGDEERSGANRNGDGFSEADTKTAHAQFKDQGHVFTDHKNHDPKKAVGKVIATAHNDPMGRVELLVDVENKKLPDRYQEKIANGEDLSWSMGSLQQFDTCSFCKHNAPTAKDHCFGAGTLVLLSNSSVKNIEDVAVGDLVTDATGAAVRVIKTFANDAPAKMFRLRTTLVGIDTVVTGNHPILTAPAEYGVCRFANRDPATFATCWRGSRVECSTCRLPPIKYNYTAVDQIRVGDYIVAPVAKPVRVSNTDNISLEKAWIIGLFAAEGCYGKDLKGTRTSVQFCLNKDELSIIDRVKRYFAQTYNYKVCIYKAGPNGVSIRASVRSFVNEMYAYAGEYARSKRFSQFIMDLPLAHLEQVAQGLLDGDGHRYENEGRRQTTKLNSASPHLVFQIRQICMLLGKQAMVGTFLTPGGPADRSNKSVMYYVQSSLFCRDESPSSALRRHLIGDRMEGCVAKLDEIEYTGQVYNLETESGSYVANGIAVHNCDHIKTALMEIMDDGQQIYMQNPNPSFFDISVVGRPADRIGYSLRKVAYGKDIVGGHELAEQMGMDPVSIVKFAMLTRLAEMEKRIPAKGSQINLRKETVRQLKQACTTMGNSAVLRKLADAAALLSPRDFADIFVGHPDPEGAAQAIGSYTGISKLADPIEIGSLDPGESRHIALSDDADNDIHESCGCSSAPFAKRLVRISILRPKIATVIDTVEADGLAQLYQHYKLAFAVHNYDRADVIRAVACLP